MAPALDPNQMWTEWKTKFLQIVDKHAPIYIKRVRSKNSLWITDYYLKERMHNRDKLKIKAIKSNDPHDWANFKRMCNKVNTEIKAAKEFFTIISLPKLMATRVKHGKLSTILHLIKPLIYRLEK